MKKRLSVFFLFALCLLLFCACQANEDLTGWVTEPVLGEAGLASFVLRAEDGTLTGVLLTGGTAVFPLGGGMTAEEFLAGPPAEVEVEVYCSGEKATLRTQSGQTIPAYPAQAIAIRRVYLGKTAVSDGTPIGIYQYGYLPNGRLYTLNDGTWLLFVETPAGPQDVFVEGTENLNDLPAKAQERILAFYEEQRAQNGLDLPAALQNAYDAYRAAKYPARFSFHRVQETTRPTASSERVLYCLTTRSQPAGSGESTSLYASAFCKATGEPLSAWELFACPAEEAAVRLLDLAGVTDPAEREEMAAALSPEHLIFHSDSLEIFFAPGSLPGQETSLTLTLPYDGALRELLQDWAVPQSANVP